MQLAFEQIGRKYAHQYVAQASTQSVPDGPDGWGGTEDSVSSVSAVAGGIADLEYSIAVHNRMKNGFQKWHRFHVVISGVLGFPLALHVWSGVYYGLRWFE